MWKAATKQITGTNDGKSTISHKISRYIEESNVTLPVPLGNRRRFGPAPVETAPPQLAQPSPSAFPRASEESPGKRPREETVTASESKFELDLSIVILL